MDQAWQRRKIGFDGGKSHSGHNLCIGCNTGKVLNLIVYSKLCRTCKINRNRGLPIPEHRCSQNFDPELSSKSMEGTASVQHKMAMDGSDTGAWIHTLLTDDDSTVRANMIHIYKAVADRDYPGWNTKEGVGKANIDWPFQWKQNKRGRWYRHYYLDRGKLPLQLPPVNTFLLYRALCQVHCKDDLWLPI